ncbi:hypothetical protein [Streptomyces sp. NPDC058335]|uniref:hypothetical protein n=1 Tax=Streptomyces sp. NPDC058335 TaxID=3346451 RepID=UPI0036677A46
MSGVPARGRAPALTAAGLATGACAVASASSTGAVGSIGVVVPAATLSFTAGLLLARTIPVPVPTASQDDSRAVVVAAGLLLLSIAVAVPAGDGAALAPLLVTAAASGLVTGALTAGSGHPARRAQELARIAYALLWLGAGLGAGCAAGSWLLPETRAAASALACVFALLRLAAMSQARRVAPPPS